MLKSRLSVSVIMATVVALGGSSSPAQAGILGSKEAKKSPAVSATSTASEWVEFHNFKGFPQLHQKWCYAAVTQAVQGAFGKQVSQAHVAHRIVFSLGLALSEMPIAQLKGDERRAVDYYWYVREADGTDEELADWNRAQKHVEKKKSMLNTLYTTAGEPVFEGLKLTGNGTPVSNAQIRKTIDRGGLIVQLQGGKSGAGGHYTIIYGYKVKNRNHDRKRELDVKVFDPLSGTSSVWSADAARAYQRQTYRVLGVE